MENNNSFLKIFFILFALIPIIPIIKTLDLIFPGHKLSPMAIILIILGFLLAWTISTYNKFVHLSQRIKQAQGGIDVYLKQRFDLIPNLVETVKGYAAYEKDVIENIVKLRSDFDVRDEQNIQETQTLNDRYTRILATIEDYPELKANESFLNLQKALSKIESQLQAARRIYNSEVTEFNTKRYKIPSNIVAIVFGFKEKPLFEIEETERINVKIDM